MCAHYFPIHFLGGMIKPITSIIFIIEQKERPFWKARDLSFPKLSHFLFYDRNDGRYDFWKIKKKWIVRAHFLFDVRPLFSNSFYFSKIEVRPLFGILGYLSHLRHFVRDCHKKKLIVCALFLYDVLPLFSNSFFFAKIEVRTSYSMCTLYSVF